MKITQQNEITEEFITSQNMMGLQSGNLIISGMEYFDIECLRKALFEVCSLALLGSIDSTDMTEREGHSYSVQSVLQFASKINLHTEMATLDKLHVMANNQIKEDKEKHNKFDSLK